MSIDVASCGYEISPMIARSQAAFRRHLPELLKTHYRQWVANHGEDPSSSDAWNSLYDECDRRGWHDDEFVVRSVEPEMPYEIDPAELINPSQCRQRLRECPSILREFPFFETHTHGPRIRRQRHRAALSNRGLG